MIRKVKDSESGPILGWKPVIALSVCNSAHFYSLCSIFSYAGFLAVDCGWAPDRDRSGYVAGLLPTAVLVGRLFTSISWGYAADRIGRRPAMIASMAAVALGNLAFGFATNIYVAIGVRLILLGMCNGWVSLMGMCTLEVAGEAYQTQVFSYIISVGSVTATLGPAIAGWTYGVLGARALPGARALAGRLWARHRCGGGHVCVATRDGPDAKRSGRWQQRGWHLHGAVCHAYADEAAAEAAARCIMHTPVPAGDVLAQWARYGHVCRL